MHRVAFGDWQLNKCAKDGFMTAFGGLVQFNVPDVSPPFFQTTQTYNTSKAASIHFLK
jgi:hypothetical protein